MNKYVRKLFGVMFQDQQTRQVSPVPLQHSPTSPEEWRAYWQAKGFPWRTEPEIDAKRQEELSKCRAIVPDILKGIYPFKGMKLSRADVEWLLATHENGLGPVIWNDVSQREREGLDLRGADLSGADLSAGFRDVDLVVSYLDGNLSASLHPRSLPLSRLHGGLSSNESELLPYWKWGSAGILLKDTDLYRASLAGADLRGASMKGADLSESSLAGADLSEAHLEGAKLNRAHLEGADLSEAHLEGADLSEASLKGANLSRASLKGANLSRASLGKTILDDITLADDNHMGPQVADIQWGETNLTVVDWSQIAILGDERQAQQKEKREQTRKDTPLPLANFPEDGGDTPLRSTNFPGDYGDTPLRSATYRPHLTLPILKNRLKLAYMAISQKIPGMSRKIGMPPLEGDSLTAIQTQREWASPIPPAVSHMLDDERMKDPSRGVFLKVLPNGMVTPYRGAREGTKKDPSLRLKEYERLKGYETAVRANRQLAVKLQDQGLNEDAARFAYRAKVLERKVFWYQVRGGQVRQLGAYLFSWFLALLTGYGYRIWRIFAAYGLLIGLFAAIYYFSPSSDHHLTWYQQVYQALVMSITALHGRTYTGQYGPATALGGVAALEGIFGLVIEGVFIAMLVQRFFGK